MTNKLKDEIRKVVLSNCQKVVTVGGNNIYLFGDIEAGDMADALLPTIRTYASEEMLKLLKL